MVERCGALDIGCAKPLPSLIEGELRRVSITHKCVVVAAQWPSWLVTLRALDLPVHDAYFPKAHHCYFKAKDSVCQWKTPIDLYSSPRDTMAIYLISGTSQFVSKMQPWLSGSQRVMVSLEVHRRGCSRKAIRKARVEGSTLLRNMGLEVVSFLDKDCGGATDAFHDFGFGSDIESSVLPMPEAGLPLCVRHFIDGGSDLTGLQRHFVSRASIQGVDSPSRTVLWDANVLRPEGLLPCYNPNVQVYCPVHQSPQLWVVRSLTRVEILRLYHLPSALDSLFERHLDLSSGRWSRAMARGSDSVQQVWLPFENSPSSVILSSIVRQLWGDTGGGRDSLQESLMEESVESYDSHNVEEAMQMEGSNQHLTGGIMTVTRPDSTLGDVLEICDEASATSATSATSGDTVSWPLPDAWADDISITSAASQETVKRKHSKRYGCDPELEMERGPPLQFNPGPPFAIGDIVFCDVEEFGLQRGLVTRADHPDYVIVLDLDNGHVVDTSVTPAYLIPSYAEGEGNTNDLAPYVEPDIFVGLRQEMTQAGSYGVHIDAQHTALRLVDEAKAYAKAVKADDAGVPVELWDNRIACAGVCPVKKGVALAAFRDLGWRWFMKSLLRDCIRFMKERHGSDWTSMPRKAREGITECARDQTAIITLLWHSTQTDWFEYKAGSRVAHFRFPTRYRKMARDGVPIHFERPGPLTKGTQPTIADPELRARTKEKIAKVLGRRYLRPTISPIKSHIKYFAVPKGEDDVRIVYDATANGLNKCVWSPSFWLPTIDTLVRGLDGDSWMTDRDVADMFLNFQLHESAIPFTGVNLSSLYATPDEVGPRLAVWERNLMGFAPSPYNSVKMALIVEDISKGDRRQVNNGCDGRELNPFQWASVKLNLPGSKDYDPSISWVSKRREDGRIACDVFTFVDDERVTGPNEELTWQASHRLASTQSYLGIQDASRKARPCSKTPGAWAGSVVHIVPELGVCVLTSRDKWTRMKGILDKWGKALVSVSPQLSHKELMSDRGFLVYIARTYPAMIPYLKGFHLTIEMWRGGRDPEGWKLKATDDCPRELFTTVELAAEDARIEYAPKDGLTTPAPRFKDDIHALTRLSKFDLPPLRVVRPSRVVHVYYGFGDASGKQFGATLSKDYNCRSSLPKEVEDSQGVRFRIGVWSAAE